jgi:hypothetical protein
MLPGAGEIGIVAAELVETSVESVDEGDQDCVYVVAATGEVVEGGAIWAGFVRRSVSGVVGVDADADDYAIFGWRRSAGRFDEDAADFRAVDKDVIRPFDGKLVGRFVLKGIADSHSCG